MNRSLRSFWGTPGIGIGLGLGLLQLAFTPVGSRAQPPASRAEPGSTVERSVEEIRRASVSWERRPGPKRQVVDLVCLVPDLATFLEAIAAWDDTHAFPILIDDVEFTFKFLRAFRPARIIRYSRNVGPVPAERLWDAAVSSVGRSWSGETEDKGGGAAIPRGDAPPRRLGPTPAGVVLSSPSSPMLAGAVALAAGRFQPLIRWEIPKHYADIPSLDEARELALGLEAKIADRIPNYGKLGDDCDFLTLAGDWPYRYHDKQGPGAFDDLIGRTLNDQRRWAFTGRLLGDSTASVYGAMCSLFLEPESTLLLNTYAVQGQPWKAYTMTQGADRLAPLAPVTLREGNRAGLSEWFRLFDPINRFGLVLINSHGTSTVFNLPGGPGQTGDIPPSVPTAVLMIHSFSASDPKNPATLAGRWLANGAFVFFGSIHEPYLQSFRPPSQVVELLADGVPLGAAIRRNPPEPFSEPWRLVYLGDPLFRLPGEPRPPRLDQWVPVASWPVYGEFQRPAANATEAIRLNWALKRALFQLQRTARPQQVIDLPTYVLAIGRERLEANLRPVYDALLIDTLLQADLRSVLLDRLSRISAAGGTPVVHRALESLQTATLQQFIAERDFLQAFSFWSEAIKTEPAVPFLEIFTERVAALANTPSSRAEWRDRLQAAKSKLDDKSPLAPLVAEELRRVEKLITEAPK